MFGARRGLVRSARALAAAALLALSGALALPGTAQAEVLVSNIGQTDDSVVNPVVIATQAQPVHHRRQRGRLRPRKRRNSCGDYEHVVVTVSLYSDSSGEPGSSGSSTSRIPTSGITADAVNTFTAPANTTLAGSNTPWTSSSCPARTLRMKAPTNFA